MIRLLMLLALPLAYGSVQADPTGVVNERDVAVFRAVIQAGTIPEPTVGDARVGGPGTGVKSRTDVVGPAVLSQTLRLCREPADDVGCVPKSSLDSIRVNAVARAAEIGAITIANTTARMIPQDLIVTVSPEWVFAGARTWSDVWLSSGPGARRRLPDCLQFTVPAYVDGAVVVYAQRLWDGRAYGWLVHLKADTNQWRVVAKKLVWASHPSA